MTEQNRVEYLDPAELAQVHCEALHSSTHTPKMPRPCLSSQEQMAIVAEAWNIRHGSVATADRCDSAQDDR